MRAEKHAASSRAVQPPKPGNGYALFPQEFSERRLELEGWPVNLTSYRIGEVFHSKADNVSPGAALARTTGATKQEAEARAIEKARERLARTRRHAV